MLSATELAAALRALHRELRGAVLAGRRAQAPETLGEPAAEAEDTIYRIDRLTEEALLELAERHLGRRWRVTLVAEGAGEAVLGPPGAEAVRLLVDPLDGTRPLMHDKRSAWILTGAAPDRGPETRLTDVVLAVMTEVPPVRQGRSDQYWAVRGGGARGEAEELATGARTALAPRPSRAPTLAHGYAQVARFFPGVKAELAAIEEELLDLVLEPGSRGRGHVFEDQYASTGGQLHELLTGRDRFTADLRPLLRGEARARGLPGLLCCHPYDLAAELVAREAGVLVERPEGGRLDAPLDATTDVAWAGYANERIKELVAPALRSVLRRRGLLP